jgi:hypothetical protein
MPKLTLDRIEDLLVNALYREQHATQVSVRDLRDQAQALEARARDLEKGAASAFEAGLAALAERHKVALGESAQVAYLRSPDGKVATLEWPDPAPKLLPKDGAPESALKDAPQAQASG